MSDRELLEFAAKAVGYVLQETEDGYECNFDDSRIWNPIADDGDALRLAVKCAQLFGFYRFLRAWLIAMATENGSPADPCAATRRAIVRAAAEIGRSMK